jgi:hypothetical protein
MAHRRELCPPSVDVLLVGRQDLLPRVSDEHLQERPIHAVTTSTPLSRMPPVLPEAHMPCGDVPLHGGNDGCVANFAQEMLKEQLLLSVE